MNVSCVIASEMSTLLTLFHETQTEPHFILKRVFNLIQFLRIRKLMRSQVCQHQLSVSSIYSLNECWGHWCVVAIHIRNVSSAQCPWTVQREEVSGLKQDRMV